MTELDAELGPLAVEVIADYGKAITLIRAPVTGAYDPGTGKQTVTDAEAETIKAVVEDYKGYDFANGLAVVGDKKLTVAASGLTIPALADKVTVDGVTYRILQTQTIMSGENACLYVIQARKT